ncbi:TPA: phage minor tail protein G [Vibrio parahaemolyticus]
MSFLNTLPLHIGKTTFIISEFTALDRLRDLEYDIELPKKPAPEANASDEDKAAYNFHIEERGLDQVSHSLALSLFHSHPGDDKDMHEYARILELQGIVKAKWPNRKVHEAYELLKKLNNPNFEPDEESEPQDPQDPPTPEKS